MKKINKLGNTLLLIDYSNIVHKSIYVNQRLAHKGNFTGGVYGFIKQLLKSIEINNADYIVICKDSKPYLRKTLCVEYKANRKQGDDVFLLKLAQTNSFIDRFLKIIGLQVDDFKGFEADDVIAQYCKSYFLHFNNIVIKSNDDDLFQLLTHQNVSLERNKSVAYTVDNFKEDFDLKPSKWIDVIALKGSHNNIKGIHGVGIKTALKIVKDEELFNSYYKEHEQMINVNRKLIRLPYQKIPVKLIKPSFYNVKELRIFLAEIGMKISINEMINCIKGIYR